MLFRKLFYVVGQNWIWLELMGSPYISTVNDTYTKNILESKLEMVSRAIRAYMYESYMRMCATNCSFHM